MHVRRAAPLLERRYLVGGATPGLHSGRQQMNVKMLSICVIATLFLSNAVSAQSANVTKSYGAVVSEGEAVFTFPINPQRHYEWCPGGLQYAWNVSAQNGNDRFKFGFSLFTAVGASPCETGDFAALLRSGQFSIWKVKGDSASIVSGNVEHTVSGDGRLLSIILRGKDAVRLIFSKRPRHVIFQAQVLERNYSREVPVVYADR